MTENEGQTDRRDQIVAQARAQIAETGALQLNIPRLTDAAGISNSLFWTYFANGDAVVATVFGELLDELHGAGLADACRAGEAGERLLRCARIYLDFIGNGGLPLYYFVQGAELARLDPRTFSRLRADLRHLLAALRRDLELSVHEGFAWIEMLVAIPEELGREVASGAIDCAMGADICDTLIGAATDAVRPVNLPHPAARRARSPHRPRPLR